MNFIKRFALVGVGALIGVACALPAVADDTELFVGVPNVVNTSQPNILFIIDDSGSMGDLVRTQPNYDPAQTYAGSCDPTHVYWRTGTGNPPACSTTRWFNKSALMCQAGVNALNTAGTYTDTIAQYNDSSGSKRWETIASNQKARYVECKADNGVHGGPNNPTTSVFPRNGVTTAANAWVPANTSQGGFVWNQSPANQLYTLYDGNYLNWLTGPTALQQKIQIVQNVATNLLQSITGVNVGLMTFNFDQGGYVLYPMEDIATARTNIISAVNSLTASSWTPLSETIYEAALYYMGGKVDYGSGAFGNTSVPGSLDPANPANYKSPLQASCQKNFIVYLTDGEPTHDTDADAKITALVDANGSSFATLTGSGSCTVETYPPGFNPSGGDCLDDLAQFLYQGDLSSLAEKQSVTTYTIGFTVDLPILADTAARGGGAYYTADDTASLTTALTNIVTSILDTQTTFVAPTVSVNSFNRTQNLNDLFISVFAPSGNVHWPGNLKKYRLDPGSALIVDVNGLAAVDPSTGFFKDSAQSIWSPNPDGKSVTLGGAANLIPSPGARNVYTNLGNANLTDPTNQVVKTNALITDALLNSGLPGDPTRDDVIDFINNTDVADWNQNGNTSEPRDQMGDPLHASPTTVIYGPTLQDAVVYFATNDGFLHAVDATTGVEKWAFIPAEFLDTQIQLLLDPSATAKNYGIDGSLRVQMQADGNGVIDPGEKVYLFFGLRRGGNAYYALDVSNPNAPVLMWRKDGTSLPGVGQSWATPVPTRMSISGVAQNAQKFVLVIGGGYEPDQDNYNASTDTTGNAIYIVDSVTGALLWHGSKVGTNKSFNVAGKAMDYSFPSEPRVVDFDGDGFADRMYAADMGGQIWRFDVINGQTQNNLITGGVIAQLGAAGLAAPQPLSATRRFFYTPDVALVNTKKYDFIHVGIGSGYRAHPLSQSNQDRFYALRDYNGQGKLSQAVYDGMTPVRDTDLVDITDNVTASVPQGQPGWRFELRDGGWIGEKVLAEARTFNNQVFFTTFRPSINGSSCEPQLGVNRLYRMSIFNGAPVVNLDGSADPTVLTSTDRYTEYKGSILSEVVTVFTSNDQQCQPGQSCVCPPGQKCDEMCVGVQCFNGDIPTNPVRTFWSEESAD
jgi:type IV pilus assembly protein PilY1